MIKLDFEPSHSDATVQYDTIRHNANQCTIQNNSIQYAFSVHVGKLGRNHITADS